MKLLVGDNPFHGISHLSQKRSRERGNWLNNVANAARLVGLSSTNGADGFMFSVSETTLSILQRLRQTEKSRNLELYAIIPYAYEYVRLATQAGGVTGLAKRLGKQILLSKNLKAITLAAKGFIRTDPEDLLKAYVLYEVSRIKSVSGNEAKLTSVMLHEIITEMALSFNLSGLIESYIDFVSKLGIKPGFETRNFAYLMAKFRKWNVDIGRLAIAAPFNKIGFQMNPSRIECERALTDACGSEIIAMSILAGGYLKISEAAEYMRTLPNLKCVVVGVSKEHHASETFRILRERLDKDPVRQEIGETRMNQERAQVEESKSC